MENNPGIICPNCESDALYKYGRCGDKQRFICLICNRQFVIHPDRHNIKNSPTCPKCGYVMHCYMREAEYVRFRCSNYPECKSYIKISTDNIDEE
jgi:ssDNA-binding Zn-finger/Zn-ribbon topoisomerase 1